MFRTTIEMTDEQYEWFRQMADAAVFKDGPRFAIHMLDCKNLDGAYISANHLVEVAKKLTAPPRIVARFGATLVGQQVTGDERAELEAWRAVAEMIDGCKDWAPTTYALTVYFKTPHEAACYHSGLAKASGLSNKAIKHGITTPAPPVPDTVAVPAMLMEKLRDLEKFVTWSELEPRYHSEEEGWSVRMGANFGQGDTSDFCGCLIEIRDAVTALTPEPKDPFIDAIEYLRTMDMNGEGNDTTRDIVARYDATTTQP